MYNLSWKCICHLLPLWMPHPSTVSANTPPMKKHKRPFQPFLDVANGHEGIKWATIAVPVEGTMAPAGVQ